MKQVSLKRESENLIPKLWVASDFVSRFLGLMGRRSIAKEEAILFPRCNSIHMFFMRFPIDVVLVSGEGVIVEIIANLKPWRLLLPRSKVRHTIEMAAGRARELGLRVGDRLDCSGAWN